MSARKRKHSVLVSSDSGTDDSCQNATSATTESPEGIRFKRKSSRLVTKRNRSSFKLPSRDAIWKDIPSVKSSEKLSTLSPRKTVNNFTKVYNSYNFEDYDDDTSEEQTSSESGSDTDSQRKARGRVKNYHRRIQALSSSSDDDGPSGERCTGERKILPPQQDNVTEHTCGSQGEDGKTTATARVQEAGVDVPQVKDGDAEYQANSPVRQDDSSDDEITPSKHFHHSMRNFILDSEDESQSKPEEEEEEDTSHSLSQSEHGSHSDTDDDGNEELDGALSQRAANLRQKKINLFSDFKEALLKRKSKSPGCEKE